jgi:hypothetical protein
MKTYMFCFITPKTTVKVNGLFKGVNEAKARKMSARNRQQAECSSETSAYFYWATPTLYPRRQNRSLNLTC